MCCPVEELDKFAQPCSPNAPSPQPSGAHYGQPNCGYQAAAFSTHLSDSGRIRWVCGHLNLSVMGGWLLVARRTAFNYLWFARCLLLVVRALAPESRYARPPLRFALPAFWSMLCVGLWPCARACGCFSLPLLSVFVVARVRCACPG